MSLHPTLTGSIPEQTARIAHAAFPKGNPYLTLRDELGTLYRDEDFSELFPIRGQPALSPWRLALVTLLQFCESLYGLVDVFDMESNDNRTCYYFGAYVSAMS